MQLADEISGYLETAYLNWQQQCAQVGDQFAQALRAWLTRILSSLPNIDWRREWQAFVEEWQLRGVDVDDPQQLFAFLSEFGAKLPAHLENIAPAATKPQIESGAAPENISRGESDWSRLINLLRELRRENPWLYIDYDGLADKLVPPGERQPPKDRAQWGAYLAKLRFLQEIAALRQQQDADMKAENEQKWSDIVHKIRTHKPVPPPERPADAEVGDSGIRKEANPHESAETPIGLAEAIAGEGLNAETLVRLKLSDAEVDAIIKSAPDGGSKWTAAEIQRGVPEPQGEWLRDEADDELSGVPIPERYEEAAKRANLRRAKWILLLRLPAFQEYIKELYELARDTNPVDFVGKRIVIAATGEEPVLSERESRTKALVEILLYVAMIKGTQYSLGKVKNSLLAPELAPNEPTAVTFQGGGRFAVEKGYKPVINEVEAALTLAEDGQAIILKPPAGARTPAGGTADATISRGGEQVPFDIKTPTSNKPDKVFADVRHANSQAQGVILDLRRTSVTLEDLGNVMARLDGSGGTNIKEVVIINKDGTVTYLFRAQP